MQKIFQKFVYFGFPDYNSLLKIWSTLIEKKIGNHLPNNVSLSNIAKISLGYTVGKI